VPRFGAPWAHVYGTTPAATLGCVLCVCMNNPPCEALPDDMSWVEEKR
jgi:hypothetical protein